MAAERIQELVAAGHTEAPEAERMVLVLVEHTVLVEVERTLELEAEHTLELEVERTLGQEEAAGRKDPCTLVDSVNNLDQH